MNCKRCGTIFPDGDKECTACGAPAEKTDPGLWNKTDSFVRKKSTSCGCQVFMFFAIVFLLGAVYIPSGTFSFRARDRAQYTRCVEALTAIKMAEEMYFEDHKEYTDDWDRLATNMIAGCTAEDGSDCKGEVLARIKNNCEKPTLRFVGKGEERKSAYKAKGTAKDRYECKICVTPDGYFPERYDRIDCGAGTCPKNLRSAAF